MRTILGALAGAAMLVVAGAANAIPDGDDYTFTLYNASSETVMSFQTGEPNGTYSQDWIPTRVLAADDQVDMRFYDSDSACLYYAKVVMSDGSEYEEQIDFCEIEDVYVTDAGFYAE